MSFIKPFIKVTVISILMFVEHSELLPMIHNCSEYIVTDASVFADQLACDVKEFYKNVSGYIDQQIDFLKSLQLNSSWQDIAEKIMDNNCVSHQKNQPDAHVIVRLDSINNGLRQKKEYQEINGKIEKLLCEKVTTIDVQQNQNFINNLIQWNNELKKIVYEYLKQACSQAFDI